MLCAYDARTGKKLWSHNNGQGHDGGIISYTAKGKQYIAVMTGWGSLVLHAQLLWSVLPSRRNLRVFLERQRILQLPRSQLPRPYVGPLRDTVFGSVSISLRFSK